MTLKVQELVMRCWFAAIGSDHARRLGKGELPPRWLGKLKQDGVMGRARKKAELKGGSETNLLAIMWALDEALKLAEPRSAADERKELKQLVKRARKFRKVLSEVSLEVELALCGDPVVEYSLADEPNEVRWVIDPLNDLKTAVEQFLDRSSSTEIAPRDPGMRPHVTTLAIRALVNLASDLRPTIDRASLTTLCEDLLAPVISLHNERRKTDHKHPDWHDRVSQIVKKESGR